MRLRALISVFTFFCTVTAFGQDRSAAIEELPPASRSAVVTQNMWTYLPSTAVENGRIDESLGIFRAAYRLSPEMTPEATPEATARKWLLSDGKTFGILTPNVLELVQEKETIGAHHLTFQQPLAGVMVYGRFVHVNLNRSGLPVMATSGYAPHLEAIGTFNPVPVIGASQAESLARLAVSPDGATSGPADLLVLPDDPPRLIWRIVVWPDSSHGEWEVLLDANTGSLIQLMDQRMMQFDSKLVKERLDGEGYVWLHDPLTASGQPYGGDYVDNNDRDNATLNSLLKNVTLQEIERDGNGRYKLNGPWVRIIGSSIPVETDPNNFKYTRNDDRFEAVMAYYFIDQSQRYVEHLNVGHPPPTRPLNVDPHATSEDNSWFQPGRYIAGFGDGGVDDAEDVGVILHEYGHVIMHHYFGSSNFTYEQRVLSEGFSDYWAISYRRHLMESGQVPMGDWREVFPWDGIAWGGRRADRNEHHDTIRQECVARCNFYFYGRTWAALMMKLWGEIGREIADRLHLVAFSYIGPNFKLADVAEALLQADNALYSGEFSSHIINTFEPRGFLPSQFGIPSISHEPLRQIYNITDPVKIDADIRVSGASITSAVVHYRPDSGEYMNTPLVYRGGTKWRGEIRLPPSTTKMDYYLQASTSVVSVFLPKSAPQEVWTVRFGRDTQAPSIVYTPITHVTPEEALLPLSIQVTDDNEVSRVVLGYTATFPANQGTLSDTVPLADAGGGTYTFNLPFLDVSENLLPGTKMEYRIIASDVADPPNVSHFPPQSMPLLRLDVLPGSNELGIWNPGEWPGLTEGEWALDRDAFGHTGNLWTTAPDMPYNDRPGISLLSFPDVNLVGYPGAQLEFWHWYDFENIGVPGPGEIGGIIYDGGQIQVSTDNGHSWTIATPQWQYNGTIDQTTSNPLAGTPAFGGSSFGWRRVRVPLPDAPPDSYRFDVSTRLAFGTGAGNSNASTHNFAGWIVRDARILIDPPVDNIAPVIEYGPHTNQFIKPGDTSTSYRIAATDDLGVESVRLHLYNLESIQPEILGTYRFAPHEITPDWYHADIPLPELPPDGILGYYITVRDFDNNTQSLGGESPERLLKLYVSSEDPRPALFNASPGGVWSKLGEGYSARTALSHQQSSIVLEPVYFSNTSERIMLRLRHAYELTEGSVGRVSVTEDGGSLWTTLRPNQELLDTGQDDFSGETLEIIDSWFDLTSLSQPYQLRVDLIHGKQKTDTGYWTIFDAEYYRAAHNAVPVPVATDLILYPNFPNPFIEETTLSYVLPEEAHVQIMLFNLLGQHVQNVTDEIQKAGGYAINLNLRGLAPGTYWIRMQAGNSLLQQPITLVP